MTIIVYPSGMKEMNRFLHVFLFISSLFLLTSCEEWFPEDEKPDTPKESSNNYVFTSDESGKYEVWKFENETLSIIATDANKDCWWPKVNNQNTQILYYQSNQSRDVNDYSSAILHIMKLDGSEDKEVLLLGQNNNFIQQGLANWSHNGERIIFAALDGGLETWQIFELNLATDSIHRVSLNNNKNYLDPIYAIDDNAIYCVTTPDGETNPEMNEIFEIEIDSGAETRITNNNFRDHHPNLSSDGRYLVYESLTDPSYLSIGKWDILQFDLNTNSESFLIKNEGIRLFPEFSKDGKKVYFTELNVENATLGIGAFEISSSTLLELESNGQNAMNASPY